jgi:hypothetical protein
MFEQFIKWIKCPSCIKATIIGLKGLLIAVGPATIAVMQAMGYPTTELEKGIATATTIIGLVLTVMEKTPAAMVKDAKDLQGVQVHVDTSLDPATGKPIAPQSVVNLANSPMPDVFPMVGGPRVPTEHDDKPTA